MTALQEVEGGIPIAEVIRRQATSRRAFLVCNSNFGGATVAELQGLEELEA